MIILPTYEFNTSLVTRLVGDELLGGLPIPLEEIPSVLRDPMGENARLRSLAWWAYRTNGAVAAAIEYMRTMHTLDAVAVPLARTADGGVPESFAANRAKLLKLMDELDYRALIRDAILRDANDGAAFYWFETSRRSPIPETLDDAGIDGIAEISAAGSCSLLPLPVDWCRIVGRRGGSYIAAFDVRYFDSLDEGARNAALAAYPKELRRAYERYRGDGRGDPWRVMPRERTIVTKIRSAMSQPWGIPFAAGAMSEIIYADYFGKTRSRVLDRVNNTVLYETFPSRQDGLCPLTSAQQKEQHDTVKNALERPKAQAGLSFFSLAAGTKLDSITVDTSIFDDKADRAAREAVIMALGISPGILNGNANNNYSASELNAEFLASSVFAWIQDFMRELNRCANALVIRDAACPVELRVLPTTRVNKNTCFEQSMRLYKECGGSAAAAVAAAGFDAEAYQVMLDSERTKGGEER